MLKVNKIIVLIIYAYIAYLTNDIKYLEKYVALEINELRVLKCLF